jgi:hypothetical protein
LLLVTLPEVSSKRFEPVMHDLADDIPDTDPMGPAPYVSETPVPPADKAPAPAPSQTVNTEFNAPVMLGGHKMQQKTEEKVQPNGCTFTFDDE